MQNAAYTEEMPPKVAVSAAVVQRALVETVHELHLPCGGRGWEERGC